MVNKNIFGYLFIILAILSFVTFGYYLIMFNFYGFKMLIYSTKNYKNKGSFKDWFKSFNRLAIFMKLETKDKYFKQLQDRTRYYFFRMLIAMGLVVLIFAIFAIIIVSFRL